MKQLSLPDAHPPRQISLAKPSQLQQRQDTDDEQRQSYVTQSALKKHVVREKIQVKLMIETWLWEKEQSHRLFNFHEGYRILSDADGPDGSTEVIGSKIIRKAGANDVCFQQASEFYSQSEIGENDSE